MLVKTAADAFFALCSVTIESSKAVSSFVGFLLSVNYEVVTSVCTVLLRSFETVATCIKTLAAIVSHVAITLWDFLVEIITCIGSILYFAWQFLHLVFRAVCLFFTAVETGMMYVWSGGKLTASALSQSAVDVADACELTWNEGVAMVATMGLGVLEGLGWLGRAAVALVTGGWMALGFVFASLLHSVAFVCSRLLRAAARLVDAVSLTATGLSNETYLGVIICCLIYLLLSNIVRYFQSSPVSLTRHQRPAGFHRDDFESDVEYSEPELPDTDDEEDGETDEEVSDDDDSSSDEVSDEDDIEFSDEDDEDDVGAGLREPGDMMGFSDSSDEEVDARLLPKQNTPYSLRSRSSTPAHVADDLTPHDFVREIERERDRRKCVVCQDQAKSVLIMPCRHMCLCVDCAHRIIQGRPERRVCPLCREKIQRVIGVYV